MKQSFMHVSQVEAETLALQALAYLASEENRLIRFLSLTGLAPTDLHARADTREIQVAILAHLLGNESELLVFASNAQIQPDLIAAAHLCLSGGA